MSELVDRMRHLVSLDTVQNGGPYEGVAAREFIKCMKEAADHIDALREALELIVDTDSRPYRCASIARSALSVSTFAKED